MVTKVLRLGMKVALRRKSPDSVDEIAIGRKIVPVGDEQKWAQPARDRYECPAQDLLRVAFAWHLEMPAETLLEIFSHG